MTVDPRGQRFAAALTSVVLVAVLITSSSWLLALQAVVFAVGAFHGVHRSPYAMVFRYLVAPRLGPPGELEPSGPPRFAQGVGFVFAGAGTVAYLVGAPILAALAAGFALFAAFLNAAFGFCLGCETYIAARRIHARLSDSQRKEVST